ncbi:MAG TPA: hypothetical protein EYP14_13535, partial [Planctomycetaceae bacterium]|nr:hypothetical protein [Planctomycetaceae bacterium]
MPSERQRDAGLRGRAGPLARFGVRGETAVADQEQVQQRSNETAGNDGNDIERREKEVQVSEGQEPIRHAVRSGSVEKQVVQFPGSVSAAARRSIDRRECPPSVRLPRVLRSVVLQGRRKAITIGLQGAELLELGGHVLERLEGPIRISEIYRSPVEINSLKSGTGRAVWGVGPREHRPGPYG